MNSKPLLCALPYVYGGMWLLWLSDSWAAALGFVLIMCVQPWLAWRCGKARDRRTLLVGNAVSFAASLVLVLLTGLCGIVDLRAACGGPCLTATQQIRINSIQNDIHNVNLRQGA